MAEEKIVNINLRKRLSKTPKWRRRAVFGRLLRKKFKNDKTRISQQLNERILSSKSPKVRVRVVKDDKLTRVELVG